MLQPQPPKFLLYEILTTVTQSSNLALEHATFSTELCGNNDLQHALNIWLFSGRLTNKMLDITQHFDLDMEWPSAVPHLYVHIERLVKEHHIMLQEMHVKPSLLTFPSINTCHVQNSSFV